MLTTTGIIIICAIVFVILCIAIGLLIYLTRDPSLSYKNLELRAKEDNAFLTNAYFNSMSQILNESAKHRFNGGNNWNNKK